jgi:hypothetical protein
MIREKFHIALNDELLDHLLPKLAALLRHLPLIGIEPPKTDADQY